MLANAKKGKRGLVQKKSFPRSLGGQLKNLSRLIVGREGGYRWQGGGEERDDYQVGRTETVEEPNAVLWRGK